MIFHILLGPVSIVIKCIKIKTSFVPSSKGSLKKIILMDLIQPHPKTPPCAPLMWTMFFTVPITYSIYHELRGKYEMVDLVKVKKWGHWTSAENLPPLWIESIIKIIIFYL